MSLYTHVQECITFGMIILLFSLCQMCVLVYASSGQLKKWGGALLVGTFIAVFAASALGYISPYSVDDPSYPMPKRFFLQVRMVELETLQSSFW